MSVDVGNLNVDDVCLVVVAAATLTVPSAVVVEFWPTDVVGVVDFTADAIFVAVHRQIIGKGSRIQMTKVFDG